MLQNRVDVLCITTEMSLRLSRLQASDNSTVQCCCIHAYFSTGDSSMCLTLVITAGHTKPFILLYYRAIQWRMDSQRVGRFEGLFTCIVLLLMSMCSNCRIKIYSLVYIWGICSFFRPKRHHLFIVQRQPNSNS